jgi:ABC-type Fe3+-hydroxamate transport system substrate-binding protein
MSGRPRVYIQASHRPPTAAGAAIADLVRAAGGEPFTPAPGGGGLEVSWEEVLEFDPQMVVYLGLDQAPEQFLAVEGWNQTEAARRRRVYSLSADDLAGPAGRHVLEQLIGEACLGWDEVEFKNLRRLA